jgi:hypothetical protein
MAARIGRRMELLPPAFRWGLWSVTMKAVGFVLAAGLLWSCASPSSPSIAVPEAATGVTAIATLPADKSLIAVEIKNDFKANGLEVHTSASGDCTRRVDPQDVTIAFSKTKRFDIERNGSCTTVKAVFDFHEPGDPFPFASWNLEGLDLGDSAYAELKWAFGEGTACSDPMLPAHFTFDRPDHPARIQILACPPT